jgi:putative ABC transport system permease protein
MKLIQCFLVALASLRANKLRSFLTMLGVIIGVGSVIVMVSLVEGARHQVVKEFEELGSNLIFVVYAPEQRESGRRRGVFEGLTLEDAEAIKRDCPLVAKVSPEMRFNAKVRHGKKEREVPVMGVGEDVNDVINVRVARGRPIDRMDVRNWRRVCVLGQKVVDALFEQEDPIGQEVRLWNVRLRVIGVLAKKGRSLGEDRDNFVHIPLTAIHKRFIGGKIIAAITVKAVSPEKTTEAADQIWELLRRRHENVQDFIVDTQEGILKSVGKIINIFALVLGGIGGLSLLVGGIGIMNIMLVSVTERTKEIGLRKAVGAKRRDILVQFLTESMTLSVIGGLFGMGFGASLSWTVGYVMKDRLPTHVPLWAALTAFVFSAAVGIFFGIYPAMRAARLDPIVALRHE